MQSIKQGCNILEQFWSGATKLNNLGKFFAPPHPPRPDPNVMDTLARSQVAVYALFIIICYECLLFTISQDLTYVQPWLLFLVTLSALQTSWLVLLSYWGGTGLCDFMEPECDLPSSLPQIGRASCRERVC